MARTRSCIRRPKIACTPPSPSWPSPWPISPSNMRRSVAFQAAMPPFLGACFGGAGLSLPFRAKLGLFLAPILQGLLCAFLCVLSGNPSELGDFPSLCSRQSSTLVRAALPGSGISAVSAPGFLFPSASPRLPPCLRDSASKSLPRFPSPFHDGPVLCLELLFPFGPLFARSGRATLP